jgi:hypothetical protein
MIAIKVERIAQFSQRSEITTPESFPLCPIAQGRNVPHQGPFLAVNVAGEGPPSVTDIARPVLEKDEEAQPLDSF